jgi:hypothetical protein
MSAAPIAHVRIESRRVAAATERHLVQNMLLSFAEDQPAGGKREDLTVEADGAELSSLAGRCRYPASF